MSDSHVDSGPSRGDGQQPDGGEEERLYLFDKPRNVQRLLRTFYGLCALLAALDLFVHRHVYHPWESLFGFYALYGFVACVLLVLIAKEMRKALMRKENYYDGDR